MFTLVINRLGSVFQFYCRKAHNEFCVTIYTNLCVTEKYFFALCLATSPPSPRTSCFPPGLPEVLCVLLTKFCSLHQLPAWTTHALPQLSQLQHSCTGHISGCSLQRLAVPLGDSFPTPGQQHFRIIFAFAKKNWYQCTSFWELQKHGFMCLNIYVVNSFSRKPRGREETLAQCSYCWNADWELSLLIQYRKKTQSFLETILNYLNNSSIGPPAV